MVWFGFQQPPVESLTADFDRFFPLCSLFWSFVDRFFPGVKKVGGFDGVPDAGEVFTVVDREDTARDLAEARRKIARESSAAILQVCVLCVRVYFVYS